MVFVFSAATLFYKTRLDMEFVFFRIALSCSIHEGLTGKQRVNPPTSSLRSTISRCLISSASALWKAMSASTPSAIISAIRPAFDKGKESGDLLFFPSQIHTHKDLAIDVGSTPPP
jgi:hypothetical protein